MPWRRSLPNWGCSQRRRRLPVATCLCWLAALAGGWGWAGAATAQGPVARPARAQEEIEGTLDFTGAAREQVERFEGMLRRNRDMSAERQAAILLWLVDLYQSLGDFDAVERSYQRILAFFPSEVGVMNSYALFLLEQRRDGERAESLLSAARRSGRSADARSLDRGRTYELLARVEMEKGDFDSAIRYASTAVLLMDEESSAAARRVLAESYRRSGDYDAAARTYIELIALERGVVTEDIKALERFIDRSDAYRSEDLGDLIERAIAETDAERRRQAAEEGAEVVAVRSADGLVLEATLRRRDGNGAILFIPDLGRSRSIFRPYAQLLGIDGISSLTLDLRGQGGSRRDSLLDQENLPARHAQRLPDDVAAGFRLLRRELKLEPKRVVIVSAGFASPIVEEALHREGLAAPVVHLSPAFTPADENLANAIAFRPDLPVLLYYSRADLHALRSCSYFRNARKFSDLEIKVVDGSSRGPDLLRRNPDALAAFQNWVRAATSPP